MKRLLTTTATLLALIAPATAETPHELLGEWCIEHTETALDVGTRGRCHHPDRFEDTMTITAEGYSFEGLTCKHNRVVRANNGYFIKTFCVEAGQPLVAGPSTEHFTSKFSIFKGKLLINKDLP